MTPNNRLVSITSMVFNFKRRTQRYLSDFERSFGPNSKEQLSLHYISTAAKLMDFTIRAQGALEVREESTNLNTNKSPILHLPAEIRLIIMKLLLLNHRPIAPTQMQNRLAKRLKPGASIFAVDESWSMCLDVSLSSQVLRTCRQIYNEGIAILYSDNCFELSQCLRLDIAGYEDHPGMRGLGQVTYLRIPHKFLKDWQSISKILCWLKKLSVLELSGWEAEMAACHTICAGQMTKELFEEVVMKTIKDQKHIVSLIESESNVEIRGTARLNQICWKLDIRKILNEEEKVEV